MGKTGLMKEGAGVFGPHRTAGFMADYTLYDGDHISISNAMFTGKAVDRVTPVSEIGPESGRRVYSMFGGSYAMNRSVYTLGYQDSDGLTVNIELFGDGYGQHFVHKHIESGIPTFEYPRASYGDLEIIIGGNIGLDVIHE